MKNSIIAQRDGTFFGWPANGGIWKWDDEILVGFGSREYQEKQDKHSINLDSPGRNLLVRSLDGGDTWVTDEPKDLNEKPSERPRKGDIDFAHDDFCMAVRGGRILVSSNRGKTWPRVHSLPSFGLVGLQARTDYIVEDKDSCIFSLTASKPDGNEGRPFCAKTTDGGKSVEFLGWITPEPSGYSIMPSTVKMGESCLVSAVRRHEGEGDQQENWIEVWISYDSGRTWAMKNGKVADTGLHGGNPPSMIRLSDDTLCLTYGRRRPPYGIRARLSDDTGETWSDEIVLRDDGRTWDIGYPRTVLRIDGTILTAYYFTTDTDREQHIACTTWSARDA